MHLKSLRINGFKSFADQTQLDFYPGTTAIVGPNGCGKSNIADAIRWVLGEQSAKALRGGKMQDVIFEGTDTRKAMPLCEVSLTLTECEKQLGSDFHEVEITRRVHRDGGGEYFLNGRPCRLKDIQKLFMDTGVGRSSYSVMAQGQIDQILSSKPEERREIFEEAAGITKYKSQRREALNKLALTDANLARAGDVMGEVTRQIGSLRRQAAKAVRYRKLAARLRHLDLAHKAHQYAEHGKVLRAAESAAAELGAALSGRRSSLEERTHALEQSRAERSRLTQELQEAQQGVFDLRSRREQAENESRLALVRRAGLEERLAEAREGLAAAEADLHQLDTERQTGSRSRAEQLTLFDTSEEAFRVRNREVTDLEQRMAAIEQGMAQRRLAVLEAESQQVRARTDLTHLEVDRRTALARRARLDEERVEAEAAVAATRGVLDQFRGRLAEAQEVQAQRRTAQAQAEQTRQQATQLFRETQRRIAELDRLVAQRSGKLNTLRQLAERFEGYSEGAKALLQGRLPEGVERAALRPISAHLRPSRENARALEALLGGALEAIAVADAATAQRLLDFLQQGEIGRACLLAPPPVPAATAEGHWPEGIRPAAPLFLDEAAAAAQPEVAALLSQCLVADSLEVFLRYWRENPGLPFLLAATPAGELVDRRGLIYGGHLRGKGSSILQRDIDISDLARELEHDQRELDAARAQAQQIDQRLQQADQEVEQARRDIAEAQQQAGILAAEERNAAKSVQEAQARLDRNLREIDQLEREEGESLVRADKLKLSLTEADARHQAAREAILASEQEIDRLRTARDERRESLSQARLELAEKRQRLELLDRGLSDLERRLAELRRRRTDLLLQIDTWAEQSAGLERGAEEQRQRAAELARTLEASQGTVERLRDSLAGVDRGIAELEAAQSAAREESDGLQERLRAEEIRLTEARSRVAFLQEEVRREHDTALEQIDGKLELWRSARIAKIRGGADLDEDENPDLDSPVEVEGTPTAAELSELESADWAAVSQEIQVLRGRVAGMGAVNLVAIEEYRELKQRHDFLSAQTQDLVSAKTQLLAAIDEINRISQQQFQETFEQIRRNFTHTFHTLFGGGLVELRLTEGTDPLESGIEITAQPPGTKLKALSLLSGGQKALTAVALLFAIYLVKPSPFCLLDELDAPLDESNIGRFTSLLRQFSSHSQFLIITHNKRTISAARAIYGVTMQERGVSKVVSMKFQTDRHDSLAIDELVATASVNG